MKQKKIRMCGLVMLEKEEYDNDILARTGKTRIKDKLGRMNMKWKIRK